MKILELFSGLECISNAFRERGHECFTVDWDERFPSSLYTDISKITTQDIIDKFGIPDVVWIGTDCTSYSVAAISKHRRKNEETGNLDPISDYAKFCDNMNVHVKQIIKELQELNPKLIYWWENPVGALRKMDFMQDMPRYTITYCQYNFNYRKGTDIWTNHPNPCFKPPCKNGMHCHEAASRGAKTGLQGIKDKALKAIYPPLLCEHIVDVCEDYFGNVKNYENKYNLEMRLDINDPVIIYNNNILK